MAKKARSSQPTPIDSLKHTEAERTNIPTEELRDFVSDDEQHPKTMRYPRNPDLDPQLVWKGKDEQDSADLEVPVVPIYIQEKIHPQAIIEDVRRTAKGSGPAIKDMFSDFNGIEFENLIEFYQHSQHWSNRMILGDSLQVLTSLAEKERLKGKVQMIYLDPPYGIKFGSNWQVSTRKRDVKDGKAEDLTRQPEQVKAFRDTWELGIHSYLAYLRDRLVGARELLSESGSLFVQIGDENVHFVRSLLDEVFGAENYVSLITLKKTAGQDEVLINNVSDYIVWYAKQKLSIKYRNFLTVRSLSAQDLGQYNKIELESGVCRSLNNEDFDSKGGLATRGKAFRFVIATSSGHGGNTPFPVVFRGNNYLPTANRHWSTHAEGFNRLIRANRIAVSGSTLAYVRFFDDFVAQYTNNVWIDVGTTTAKKYVVETGPAAIQRCLLMTTDPGDLVLDPTCGSGTTAYVAEQWGRRWITIDTSRVALALARTRLMAARFPFYLLADSHEGRKKAAELTGVPPSDDSAPPGDDIRQGFVYKTVPHVTLKSIANNDEIDDIHAQWQETLEPLRAQLNAALKETWEEWEIPREAETPWPPNDQALFARIKALRAKAKPKESEIKTALHALNHNLKRAYTLETLPERPADPWPEATAKIHQQWSQARHQRQQEIDASIALNAGQETLYDQPYEDKNRLRVTGPFTVESLSPHRMLPTHLENDDEATATDGDSPSQAKTVPEETADFATMILDNLRKAGVQNTVKNERLHFERLEPFAGHWLHAEGDYSEKDGESRRVAVSFGPEHGTVGALQIKEAAKEAVQGVGFDLLLVCGFAFDPSVPEEAKRYGKLTILPVKMNPDLAMGDDLLKKTGSGNLFMIFGEPDIAPVDPETGRLLPNEDGQYQIEIKGVDIYDPTTGQIRSNGTADIACWFIDTNYNGESFFVRHAYFTGADKPYDKLKKALKAEVDESAWEALYRTKSRPFNKPESGKVAVKVINHYGDEVLKVFLV